MGHKLGIMQVELKKENFKIVKGSYFQDDH